MDPQLVRRRSTVWLLSQIPWLLLALLQPDPVAARVIAVTPKNYRRKLSRLRAGDVLLLTPGRYAQGMALRGLHGTARAPITILGRGRAVLLGRRGSNTLDLSDASHLVIRNLIFDGQGLPVDAIKAQSSGGKAVHHITIEDCTISGHGASQQTVGISTKAPAWDWVIRRNTIVGAGTGMYLGNSNGEEPFIRGTIEYNLVRDPVGYCIQIKRQNARPSTPGMPTGPCTTVIRHNLLVKGDIVSPDGPRPNLLVGGFPETGPGSDDRYQIYGNLLYHNVREPLFQGTGRISLQDNLFVSGKQAAISIRPHHGREPKQIRIYHNTIYRAGEGILVSGMADGGVLQVFANLIAAEGSNGLAGAENQLVPTTGKLFASSSVAFGKLDLQPQKLLRIKLTGDRLKQATLDLDHDRDFLGRKKAGFDHCGAYGSRRDRSRPIKLAPLPPRKRR